MQIPLLCIQGRLHPVRTNMAVSQASSQLTGVNTVNEARDSTDSQTSGAIISTPTAPPGSDGASQINVQIHKLGHNVYFVYQHAQGMQNTKQAICRIWKPDKWLEIKGYIRPACY